MLKEITIPEISENVTSGNVVEVLVSTGDDVKVDDTIIEFETEKAVVEIPSPYDGRITEVLAREGDEMNVGDVIAKLETEPGTQEEQASDEKEDRKQKAPEKELEAEPERQSETAEEADTEEEAEEKVPSKEEEKAEKRAQSVEPDKKGPEQAETGDSAKRRSAETRVEPAEIEAGDTSAGERAEKRAPAPASPSVRRFARELGVDIHSVQATGERINIDDIKSFVKNRLSAAEETAPVSASAELPSLPDFSRWGEIETQELTGVRRLTAKSMSASWHQVVHVTQFEQVDITDATQFIERNSKRVADQGGKLTLTAILVKICALALKRFPQFNTSLDLQNGQLIFKNYIHIGLAVDTPRGLLVPVLRDADRKTVTELAVEIVDLAKRARSKKIKPDEMEGGTFTISNQGGIGGTAFTPVVFWPQAAILGVGRSGTEPQYVEGDLVARQMLPLALSYDHRIVDGADAARFIAWIRECLERPLTLHLD